jgi:adenylylsulfate kinase-like enzyme
MLKTKIIKNIKHGIVFWITGFPGSGKTKISSLLHKKIEKKFGKTVRFSGDDLRIILNLKGYSKKEREKIGNKYHEICKRFSSKGINVLIDVVCLIDSVRKKNKRYLNNYVEIYIKTNFKKVLSRKQKFFYVKKSKNVWGNDLRVELPKKPHITQVNSFTKTTSFLSKEIFNKIITKLS